MTTPRPRPPPELSIVIKSKLDTKELGGLLRTIRTSAKMTQVELARKLGVPQQNVAQFETGDRELMLSTMNKFVRALGWELTLTAKSISPTKGARDSSDGDGASKLPGPRKSRSKRSAGSVGKR
jgi:transcriptional regulator with XRE-family HTH domain